MAVTYPAEARAQLELPASARGARPRAAAAERRGRRRGAEGGGRRRAPGVRRGRLRRGRLSEGGRLDCRFTLADDHVTELDPAACTPVAPPRTAAKGERRPRRRRPTSRAPRLREKDRWAIEASLGLIGRQTDAYTDRLSEFGYDQRGRPPALRLSGGVSRDPRAAPRRRPPGGHAVAATSTSGRSTTGRPGVVPGVRRVGAPPRLHRPGRVPRHLRRAGAGAALGVVELTTQQTGVPPSTTTTSWGYLAGGAIGVTARLPHVVTLFAQVGYDHAPVLRNLIGDTHDSGGVSEVIGLRVRLGDGQ